MKSRRRIRLALFATHPIQYQVPWFRALATESAFDVDVYYAILPDATQQGTGFGVEFEWDLPLLDGYRWQLLENVSAMPSLDRFRGCDVRDIVPTLRQQQPDVALMTGWNSLYLVQALWACRRLGIPTLVRGDSNVLAPRGLLKSHLQRLLIRQFSAFLAVGEFNRRLYEQAGIDSERIFFCPHFVDNDRFSIQAEKLRPYGEGLRKHWGIPNDAICFLFSGKLAPKKRVADFLQAIAEAAKANSSIHGLVVGAGEQLDEARTFVDRHRAPIHFAGFLNQNEIAAAYVAADCLVLPSDWGETWGLVVNEAMACKLPAIVSDQVGCGPDLLVTQGAETGAIFPVGDGLALQDIVLRFSQNREKLKKMGATAHDLVTSRYSLSATVAGTLAALAWLEIAVGRLGCE